MYSYDNDYLGQSTPVVIRVEHLGGGTLLYGCNRLWGLKNDVCHCTL